MATPGALSAINPDHLIDRIANGAIPSRLATELGVTKRAVYYHLADRPDWIAARQTGMAVRLDEAEIAIQEADEQLSLSRAREQFRATAWRAEREYPDKWGQKQQSITINVLTVESALPGTIDALLSQVRGLPDKLEAEAESVALQQQIGDAALLSDDSADYVKSDTD